MTIQELAEIRDQKQEELEDIFRETEALKLIRDIIESSDFSILNKEDRE